MRPVLALLVLTLATPASAGKARVRWYASAGGTLVPGRMLVLDASAHTLKLAGGRTCKVSAISRQLPLYEAWTTTCRRGEAVIEFSVQCEQARPKDHAQVRFPDAQDFIEVGCELREG